MLVGSSTYPDSEALIDTPNPHIAEHPEQSLWFNNVSDAIFVTDANWVIQHWNSAAEQIYGWPSADVIGQPISEIIPTIRYIGGDTDSTAAQTLIQEGVWRGTFVQHTRAGQELVIEGSTRARFDTQGMRLGYIGINRDMTDHYNSEQVLRTSEERFRAMIENGEEVVMLLDTQRRITYVSPNITRILGYQANVTDISELLPLIHPDDHATLHVFTEHIFATPAQYGDMTLRTHHQDGSWHWFESHVINQLHNPSIQSVIVSFRDVTERKLATAAFRQSEDRFRSAFHASPVPFIITDALTGRYVEVNDSLLNLMGYTRDELDGQTVLTLNVFIDVHAQTAIRELLATERVVRDYPTQTRTKSGVILQVLVSVTELTIAAVACLFVVVVDITSRVQTERALQRAAERLTVIHAIDRALLALHTPATIAGTILARLRELIPCQYANVSLYAADRNSATILGAQGELPGAHPVGIPMPYTTDDDFVAMHRGEPWLSNDLRHEPGDDPIVRRLLSLEIRSALRIPLQLQGDLSGVLNLLAATADAFTSEHVTIAQEIADMLALALHQEQLIEALQQELAARTQADIALTAEHERIVRLKNEFMATMSHELRTPLAAVLGQSELLLEEIHGPLSQRQQTAIQRITNSGQHLLAIINDILDYTLFESGAPALHVSPVAVASLCRDSTRMVMKAAQAKQIFIITTLDSAVSTIQADARRLQQVLINLLANAIKFTPDGGEVGLEVQSDALGAQVIFTVWDTGIGIAEADLPRLFQPFTQLDGRLSREYEGTGLGLALVLRLVEAHGGSIQVSSTPGQGSRFRVALPWAPDGANGISMPGAGN